MDGRSQIMAVFCSRFCASHGWLAEKLGMRKEGVRRQALFENGAFVDVVQFGLLQEEFRRGD